MFVFFVKNNPTNNKNWTKFFIVLFSRLCEKSSPIKWRFWLRLEKCKSSTISFLEIIKVKASLQFFDCELNFRICQKYVQHTAYWKELSQVTLQCMYVKSLYRMICNLTSWLTKWLASWLAYGVNDLTCDLTCTGTKWLVTWLATWTDDLWLDLDLHKMTCDLTWTCKVRLVDNSVHNCCMALFCLFGSLCTHKSSHWHLSFNYTAVFPS